MKEMVAQRTLTSALFVMLALVLCLPAAAQIRVETVPPSIRLALDEAIPTVSLSANQFEAAAHKKDLGFADPFGFAPVEVAQNWKTARLNVGLDHAGQWTTTPEGGRIWRLRLVSEGAAWIRLVYDDFFMPPGAQFFLYGDDRNIVRGAFTEQNNKRHGGFATEEVPGDATILEYYEPAGAPQGRLHVARLEHGLEEATGGVLSKSGSTYTPKALSCSINTGCIQGSGWESEAQAIVHFNGCTGVLVNNVREDGKAYILTANHCGYPVVGDTLDWVFKFNYQSASCDNPSEMPNYQTLSGAVVRVAQGGSADITLLELLEPIPSDFNVTYAGWSIDDIAPARGTVIGHPKGDIKKISFDDNPANKLFSYWDVAIDHGTIEMGSSGSPLFNEQRQVVGLVRSARTIDQVSCSGPDGDDNNSRILFPRFASLWHLGTPGQRVVDFLDPDGTGTTSLSTLEPVTVWVNEVNANKGNKRNEYPEFVELAGVAGTSLSGYTVEVYECSNGTTSLLSSEVLKDYTFADEYHGLGFYVIGDEVLYKENAGQHFAPSNILRGPAKDHLPDGVGLILVKDQNGKERFDYQYGTTKQGTPCGPNRKMRSEGDGPGRYTMGFKSEHPSANEKGLTTLMASPGAFNLAPVSNVEKAGKQDATTEAWVESAYPNPFNPETTIRFAVPETQQVRVDLYDMLGRRMMVLYEGTPVAGQWQTLQINGSALASGVYLVHLQGENMTWSQKVTLSK